MAQALTQGMSAGGLGPILKLEQGEIRGKDGEIKIRRIRRRR